MLIFVPIEPVNLYTFNSLKLRNPFGGRKPPTIAEDNEGNAHISVARTLTQMDPEGKVERDV